MATFKEFLTGTKSNALVSLSSHKQEVANSSTKVLLSALSGEDKVTTKEAQQFSNELSEIVHSENFIDELSASLPDPKLAGSKEEYVAKAKAEMKALLVKKLAK